MSEADRAAGDRAPNSQLFAELKVSGHLMNLDAGLFCIVQAPSANGDVARGLPGVRISVPPGSLQQPDAVTIKSFREDGWLQCQGDAALVRVSGGPAQILVTVYQAQGLAEAAPNLQVLRLIDPAAVPVAAPAPPPEAAVSQSTSPTIVDVVAHIQGRGDVGGRVGEWIGEVGSKRWIEGFALAPLDGVSANDVEYQAVLGRGWMSPWVEGGQFCGSRGMALPLLGLRVRLRGEAATKFDCSYSANFVDGAAVGPVENGAPCETASLAAIEAFQISIRPRNLARDVRPVSAAPRTAPPVVAAQSSGRARASAKASPAAPAKTPKSAMPPKRAKVR